MSQDDAQLNPLWRYLIEVPSIPATGFLGPLAAKHHLLDVIQDVKYNLN